MASKPYGIDMDVEPTVKFNASDSSSSTKIFIPTREIFVASQTAQDETKKIHARRNKQPDWPRKGAKRNNISNRRMTPDHNIRTKLVKN
uniref:Uncharacterized protein n=1 Tax=Oryza brachyantha TaxID=4533 RepID=J3N1F7_ORYBR